ncbi:hypothetical protein ASG47_09565 [Devosia sp. Leaf420]|uniref:hypothetical protein n=1 Tax=Devosia sp. Leaf420 TaxID=1736374 RepID=UPI000715790D|nr:hypothetical protein [Devosia sp. Leaf420]KQT48574.1 hypothetical protein ASG47_09565 [Devosia sp. Leaf420]
MAALADLRSMRTCCRNRRHSSSLSEISGLHIIAAPFRALVAIQRSFQKMPHTRKPVPGSVVPIVQEQRQSHITGHSGEDISRKYCDYLVQTLSQAIEKKPRHDIADDLCST